VAGQARTGTLIIRGVAIPTKNIGVRSRKWTSRNFAFSRKFQFVALRDLTLILFCRS
jgi:hypothetical protein